GGCGLLPRALPRAPPWGGGVAAKSCPPSLWENAAPPPDPDTLEEDEWKVFKALPVNGEDVSALLGGLQAKLANQLARDALPLLEAQTPSSWPKPSAPGKPHPSPKRRPRDDRKPIPTVRQTEQTVLTVRGQRRADRQRGQTGQTASGRRSAPSGGASASRSDRPITGLTDRKAAKPFQVRVGSPDLRAG